MIRNKALIKGLEINGHDVNVLTLPSRENDNYFDKSVDVLDSNNIVYAEDNKVYSLLMKDSQSNLGVMKQKITPFLRKIYHSFSLFDNSITVANNININLLNHNYYDLVISSSDPKSSHVAVSKMIEQGLKYGKWIQYWGDPLALDITKKTFVPNILIKKVERRILEQANQIIYVSPFTLKEQKNEFSKLSLKMDFIPIPYLNEKIYKMREFDKKNVKLGYFGDYNSKVRNILPFYSMCEENEFNCIIAGNSDLLLDSTNRVTIFKRTTQDKVEEFEEKCDILVCILNKKGAQIPGKLYHYAATNKPVLVILDGENADEIDEYLRNYRRFYTCENNKACILNTIVTICEEKIIHKPYPGFRPERIANRMTESFQISHTK